MKLWLITQSANGSYDTYDSAVVAAETEAAARLTHPSDFVETWGGEATDDWAAATVVDVELVGDAKPGTAAGVILASFNAG